MRVKSILLFVLIFTLLLSACASTAPALEKSMPADSMPKDAPTADAMMKENPTSEAVMDATSTPMENKDAMMQAPAWFSASLTDVTNGESFTIQDYQGKVVLVETMATWCSNCFKQQNEVIKLHEMLGERSDFISLGVAIDPNEDAEILKAYIQKNGFDWKYVVSPVEVSREISQLYGDQFLNPPSTPMLIIDRHGEAHPLPFGIKNAADLQKAIEPFLNENM